MQSFPYEVVAPTKPIGTFQITARVPVPEGANPAEVITYLRSHSMKADIQAGWVRSHSPTAGLEVRGGPRPVFADPQDRTSKVLAYEQDYRICSTGN